MSFHGFSSESAFKSSLDRHITGNYGDDQLRDEEDAGELDPYGEYDPEDDMDAAYDRAVELDRAHDSYANEWEPR